MFSRFNFLKTLIGFFIGIIAMGIIALAFLNAKSSAYEKRVTTDVSKIVEALKVYKDVNGFYPPAVSGMPREFDAYLDFYPATSTCSYNYQQTIAGDGYKLTYCLSDKTQTITEQTGS